MVYNYFVYLYFAFFIRIRSQQRLYGLEAAADSNRVRADFALAAHSVVGKLESMGAKLEKIEETVPAAIRAVVRRDMAHLVDDATTRATRAAIKFICEPPVDGLTVNGLPVKITPFL